ncbi:MAG: mismatch-specific DNA-glycosylase [Anaerolineae bacterium]|nr:mismatch-specific DNA-glycosylase [Anaerolineae bacterium]
MTILPDVLQPDLKIVFYGMAASKKSADAAAYYAGPGNAFWPVLHCVGLTPRQFEPHEYRDLLDYGCGLTNLEQEQIGNDDELDFSAIGGDTLRAQIEEFQPRILAFVGKRAAQKFLGRKKLDYGLQPDTIGDTAIWVLPSTSGAARRYWDESHWQALADTVKAD